MRRSRLQIDNELYSLIKGKDLTMLASIIMREFPKHRGTVSELSNDQLEKILPEIRRVYSRVVG